MPQERAPSGTSLYVHLPFCQAKCHYCDFFSLPAEGQDIGGTLDAIVAESAQRSPRSPRTLFIGGGTPSLLSIAELRYLLDALEEHTGFRASSSETTLECNPESLDRDKAAALLDLGVTRLSIGFQSLDPKVLELFGRVHTTDQSLRAYDAARQAGVRSLNIDMIFAAPGTEGSSWGTALGRVLDLEPEHLSAYNLAFEEDTVFSRWLDQGRIKRMGDDAELELLYQTRAAARAAGLEPYEISNFARAGEECAHNLGYWANKSYVGIGPSAVSCVQGRRAGNAKALQTYRRRVGEGTGAEAWSEQLEGAARLGETWWLGLRTQRGVKPSEARETAGWQEHHDPAETRARALAGEGLLEESRGCFCLTEQSLALADHISAEFLVAPPTPSRSSSLSAP
ncbi:MAG: radical SAM family heme chaperone HemW [bacterium]